MVLHVQLAHALLVAALRELEPPENPSPAPAAPAHSQATDEPEPPPAFAVDDPSVSPQDATSPAPRENAPTTAEPSVAAPMPAVETIGAESATAGAPPPEPMAEPPAEPQASSAEPTSGGGFFDLSRIRERGIGGALQIHGFVAANFFVATRSDIRRRDGDGRFVTLDPLPYFDVRSATLYFGAPIFSDAVYARIGLEFISIPTQQDLGGNLDIIAQSRRYLFFETAAIEINPFAWARNTPTWFHQGFKLTAGLFIVPFGLEDQEHAAPTNWFISRPLSMTNNRVYPGTWVDVGATLTWAPKFESKRSPRPVIIDLGVVNGDACTQTRFLDQLYSPNGLIARCERVLREEETIASAEVDPDPVAYIDNPIGFALADNNGGKSVVLRTQFFPLPAFNFGGSFVYGHHPEGGVVPSSTSGMPTPADLEQAPTWRVGAHLDLDFDNMFASPYPLPHLRGEFVYGKDEAVERSRPTQTTRAMLGGYVQVAQPLFRRKKSRLQGLVLQYRFDHSDPDLTVPGRVGDAELTSDLGSGVYLRETAFQAHTVGLRLPVLPRFTMKAEYSFVLEDGGVRNQIANDLFGLEAVVDF